MIRIGGIQYDTETWRFRVNDRVSFEDAFYVVAERVTLQGSGDVPIHTYRLMGTDGQARFVRNYVLNLEGYRAGVARGTAYQRNEDAYLQQLRDAGGDDAQPHPG